MLLLRLRVGGVVGQYFLTEKINKLTTAQVKSLAKAITCLDRPWRLNDFLLTLASSLEQIILWKRQRPMMRYDV